MAWKQCSGLPGNAFLPDTKDPLMQKHACENCFACLWCDETRCHVCRHDHRSEASKEKGEKKTPSK